MTDKKADLLSASKKVMDMAAARRDRMKKRKTKVAASPKAADDTTKRTASAKKAPAKKKAATKKKVAAKKAPVKKAAPVKKKTEKVAADAKVKALDQPNGGFEGSPLSKAPDNANTGEEDYGYAVPPELEKAIDEGKAEDPKDESYQPGVLIPPGLEEAVMAVADPEDIPEDEEVRFDLVPFTPEEAETTAEVMQAGAHWVLFANGSPLAKIDLKEQEHAEKIAGHFVSPDFARMVIDGIGKHGLKATLAELNAKPYVAKLDKNKKIVEIKAKLEAASQEALRQKIAATKTTYVEMLGFVLEAASNNFILGNEIKDALIADMRSAGLPEKAAAEMVDNAFFRHGPKTIANWLDKAEEWSNLPTEAFAGIKEAAQGAGRRVYPLPSERSFADANPNYDHDLAASMAAKAPPIQTRPATDSPISASVRLGGPAPASEDAKAAYREKHGGFRS